VWQLSIHLAVRQGCLSRIDPRRDALEMGDHVCRKSVVEVAPLLADMEGHHVGHVIVYRWKPTGAGQPLRFRVDLIG